MQATFDGQDRQRSNELKMVDVKIAGIHEIMVDKMRSMKEEMKTTMEVQKEKIAQHA